MNSSLWSTDRCTHFKIVAVAFATSFAVIFVGIHAKGRDATNAPADSVRPAPDFAAVYLAQSSTVRQFMEEGNETRYR
jgi:hypothetical protein